jgi:Cohesin domain/Dockerin type I domain
MNKSYLQKLLLLCLLAAGGVGQLFAQAPTVITCPPAQTLTCFETVPAPAADYADFITAGGTISDDCSSDPDDFTIISQDSNNGGTNCPGSPLIINRTYTIADDCGNSATCTQTFTYQTSTQGPVITSILPNCYKYCASLANPMASDITFQTDCSFDATVNITGPTQIGATNCPGTIYRYTYTVTDDCGRTSAPVTRDFIIGNNGPSITCPPFNLILHCGDPNNTDYINAHFSLVQVNTSCELPYTLTHTPQNFNNITCNTATTVTFTATDACGRTSTCTTTVTIKDVIAPEITVVPPSVCDVIECGADANFWFNHWINYMINGLEAEDACDSDVSITALNPQLNQTCGADGKALSVVTFRATDNCNNTSTITGTFTIENTAPALFENVPANTTVECGSPLNFGTPSVIEQCQTTITFVTVTNNSNPCNITSTRTWTATDACGGLTATASQTITQEDTTPPVAPNAPANVTLQCAANIPPPVNLTAVDACTGNITVAPTAATTAGSCANNFTMVRTWTFTDACGNSSSVSQTITVNDNTAPQAPAALANVTVQCAADVPAPVNLTAVDNCSGNITVAPTAVTTPGSCANKFTMVRTWTFTDACGNSSSVSQTITVNDNTAPVAPAAPANVTLNCGDPIPAPVSLTAIDNCSGSITVGPTEVTTPGGCAGNSTIVRTWTFTDACGNSSSVSQTISIGDNTPPTFTFVPADYESPCIDDNGNITVYAQVCASSDDAEEDESNGNEGKMNLTSSDLEMSLDDSQNKNVKVGVRFKDLNIPQGAIITSAYIQFSADATIDVDPSELTIHGQDADNAGTFINTFFNISNRPQTDASVEWTPGDWQEIGDNLAEQRTPDLTAIVQEIVNRTGFSTASAMAFIIEGIGKRSAISYDLNPNQAPELYVTYAAGPLFGTPQVSDDCGTATLTSADTSEGGCEGSRTRTWTLTDACGNTSTAAQTIHFTGDNVPPVFTFVPAHVDSDCDYQTFPPVFGTPIAEDNCEGPVNITFVDYFYEGDENGCEDILDYEYRRRWTATDECGNTTTAVQNYDVNADDYSSIVGFIYTEEEAPVEGVQVSMEGFGGFTTLSATAGNGTYGTSDLIAGDNYTVKPTLDINHLNGVSTYDLVLISKHILQTQPLDSPYKLIAADINRSGTITTFDLVELRKVILLITQGFTNNTSWRFVEAGFSFPQPNNPFATAFPEYTFINGLVPIESHNYIGVKVGDVNNTAVANSFTGAAEAKNAVADLTFVTKDAKLNAGDTYEMVIRATDFNNVSGFQFTLNFDAAQLELQTIVPAELSNLSTDNFGFTKTNEGAIMTSWNSNEGVSMSADAALFTVTFKAKRTVEISEAVSISSRYLKAEAYNNDLQLLNVDLRFEGSAAVESNKGFTLYQNQPNPFKSATVIGFELPEAAFATLTIHDVSGRLLKQIEGDFAKGYNEVEINKNDLQAAGVAYYRLVTADFEATKSMLIIK